MQKTIPLESTTAVAVHNHSNIIMFSVAFVSQRLPVNSLVQSLLIGLQEHLYRSILVLGYHLSKFVIIPIIIFILTCWPCLICVSHCCCWQYVCSRNWVCTFILLLPLLIGIYYPIVLLVYYTIFLFVSFSAYSFFICLVVCDLVKHPEDFVFEIFLPYIMFGDLDDTT